MTRCPCCNARLSSVTECPRCGADLSRLIRCELLSKQWLALSLQALKTGRTNLAAGAVKRAMSYRQSNEARIFHQLIIRLLYNKLYNELAVTDCQRARQVISSLQLLQGNNEALDRFRELIDHLESGRFHQKTL